MLDNFTLRDSATEAYPREQRNVKFYYSERAKSLIEEAGARALHITSRGYVIGRRWRAAWLYNVIQ